METTFERHQTRIAAAIMCCTIGMAGAQVTDARDTRSPDQKALEMNAVIKRIFEQNIRRETRVIAPGVEAYTRVPIATSDIAKVTAFGDEAVPALAEYLNGSRERFRELALTCLGFLGTSKAIRLIRETTLSTNSQVVRIQALEWLGTLPGAEAERSLQIIAQDSGDAYSRKRAAELLSLRQQPQ